MSKLKAILSTAKTVAEVLAALDSTFDILGRGFGFIEKKAKVNIDGVPGKLVWDYILWNDITFETKMKKNGEMGKKKKQYVLYSSWSDKKTKKKWKKLIAEYGV